MTVALRDGGTAPTKNFIDNGETVADVVNKGEYVLAGSLGYCLGNGTCPTAGSATDFSIVYDANHQLFNILLLKEPLRTSRINAEQFLMDKLDVSKDTLCQLNYWIGVTSQVNSYYAGENLGFSFCEGSTPL